MPEIALKMFIYSNLFSPPQTEGTFHMSKYDKSILNIIMDIVTCLTLLIHMQLILYLI